MPGIINFGIIKHPLNWITVMLMVFIAGIAVHMILKFQNVPHPTTGA